MAAHTVTCAFGTGRGLARNSKLPATFGNLSAPRAVCCERIPPGKRNPPAQIPNTQNAGASLKSGKRLCPSAQHVAPCTTRTCCSRCAPLPPLSPVQPPGPRPRAGTPELEQGNKWADEKMDEPALRHREPRTKG